MLDSLRNAFLIKDRPASRNSVVYVIVSLGWGGAQTQVIDLARDFASRGWKVTVVSMLAGPERKDVLERDGIGVLDLGMKRGLADPRAVDRLASIVRKLRPAIVHAHMFHATLLARVTRLLAPMPVLITSAHNTHEGAYWRIIAYRLTDNLSDLTTNVSTAAVRRLVRLGGVPSSRIRRVGNGVDATRFQRTASASQRLRRELQIEDRFVWLAVGRLEEQKDYGNLLHALDKVISHPRRPILLIVGDGPLQGRIEQDARRMSCAEHVRFLGVRTDIPDLLSAADAYVLSSAWEGLPMVLLEAAAAGLPVVATDVGGCAEIVSHEESGFLVRPRDADSLANAMQRTMEMSADRLAKMGSAGTSRVMAEFSMKRIADQWQQIYEELLPYP